MKWASFALICACTTTTHAVEIAAPLSSAPVAAAREELALPSGARALTFLEEADWAADFPQAKTFAAYDLPSARRVLLTWRMGKARQVNAVAASEDYPGNHVARLDLVVQARDATRTIAFGELAGSATPPELSWCARDRYEPPHPAFGAAFYVGIIQGGDEMVVVRSGKSTLHVLHRETSDGYCPQEKQGPLDVCGDSRWERVADLRAAADVSVYETIEDEGKPFDCGTE